MTCPTSFAASCGAANGRASSRTGILCRFLGRDSDVNIATKHPEFNDWKWVEPAELPDLIVPFKRDLYRRLLEEFRDHLTLRGVAFAPPAR